VTGPTSVVLSLLDTPADLPGTRFAELLWEHRPRGPALATLLTGRDVFVHRRACEGDEPDPRLPTLPTLLESRGVELADAAGVASRPRFALELAGPPRRADGDDATTWIVVAPNGCWLPGPTRTLRGLVRLIDVAATVLDAFGMIDVGCEHGFQGESLLDLAAHGDESGTCRECYLTDCARRGWRTRDGEAWEPDLPPELAARVRGYVRRRVAESGLVDPLVRVGPEPPPQ
jgi:hypothetical protein